jgi:transketolase
MRRAFGKAVVQIAKKNPNVVLMTGDVEQEIGGAGQFKELFPDRYYNLGLCEQAWVTMAAGMALEGLRPIIYSLTPFILERAFEQIKLDIDAQDLPVMMVGYDSYESHGISHRCLNAEDTCKIFRNVQGYFPRSMQEAEAGFLNAYIMKKPSFHGLKRDGLPFF